MEYDTPPEAIAAAIERLSAGRFGLPNDVALLLGEAQKQGYQAGKRAMPPALSGIHRETGNG